MAPDAPHDEVRTAPPRPRPLAGAVGVTVVAVIPLLALVMFVVLGLAGFWSWSGVFFLLIPISGVVVYGFRGSAPSGE